MLLYHQHPTSSNHQNYYTHGIISGLKVLIVRCMCLVSNSNEGESTKAAVKYINLRKWKKNKEMLSFVKEPSLHMKANPQKNQKNLRQKFSLRWLRISMSNHNFSNLCTLLQSDLNKKLTSSLVCKNYKNKQAIQKQPGVFFLMKIISSRTGFDFRSR